MTRERERERERESANSGPRVKGPEALVGERAPRASPGSIRLRTAAAAAAGGGGGR
ncbi:unnamed protein product [Spirodela intermedia]|uniref:Uncharacterized protein n=1 Tax=Spirodela intermedia TaxID=51605 RepID=A0A7I8KMJ1_SPIIN|nr:unnamed protein product [Spirodela intermedia]